MILDGRVLAVLSGGTRFADVRHLDATDSTMRVVAELAAAGAPEGLVVSADHQTAGRGRRQRTWEDRPGDALLVSVLLRPQGLEPDRLGLVTSAVALAARDACTALGAAAEIKWPNDLLVGDAKLAGILAESTGGAVVVGMGLNVHSAPPGAACLDGAAGRRVGRAEVLERWLTGMEGLLDDWDEVARRYRAGCSTVGRPVEVELAAGRRLRGTAVGTDRLGRLEVRTDDGERHVVAVGDVTHLRAGPGPPS